MNEMVERVARAVHARRWQINRGWLDPWDELSKETKVEMLADASAAIAAMREPTKAMIQAGYDAPTVDEMNLGRWKLSQVRADYEAMIDAALACL
jgi:hypothetical protein